MPAKWGTQAGQLVGSASMLCCFKEAPRRCRAPAADLGSYVESAAAYLEAARPQEAVRVYLQRLGDVAAAAQAAEGSAEGEQLGKPARCGRQRGAWCTSRHEALGGALTLPCLGIFVPAAELLVAEHCAAAGEIKLAIPCFCKAGRWEEAFSLATQRGELQVGVPGHCVATLGTLRAALPCAMLAYQRLFSQLVRVSGAWQSFSTLASQTPTFHLLLSGLRCRSSATSCEHASMCGQRSHWQTILRRWATRWQRPSLPLWGSSGSRLHGCTCRWDSRAGGVPGWGDC